MFQSLLKKCFNPRNKNRHVEFVKTKKRKKKKRKKTKVRLKITKSMRNWTNKGNKILVWEENWHPCYLETWSFTI